MSKFSSTQEETAVRMPAANIIFINFIFMSSLSFYLVEPVPASDESSASSSSTILSGSYFLFPNTS